MPIFPAAQTQGSMQAALNALRETQQGRQLNFAYMNAGNARDLADRQLAMNATHTLRSDKAQRKASADDGGGAWGSIAGLAAGALLGPAGALLPSMAIGSSIGGAVDRARAGQPGGAQQISSGISSALDIYTEMQQFDVPEIQPYMSDRSFTEGFPKLGAFMNN